MLREPQSVAPTVADADVTGRVIFSSSVLLRSEEAPAGRGSKDRSLSLTGILFLLTGLAFLTLAFSDLRQSIKFVDVFLTAERLEENKTITAHAALRAQTLASEIVNGNYCRSDIILSGVTIALNRLDNADIETDYNSWLGSAKEAETLIVHSIRCMPTNANLWLRLAVVKAAIAESPTSTARWMTLSSSLAPYDEPIALARLYFWNHFSAATLKEARSSVMADLTFLLRSGDSKKIAQNLANLRGELRPYIVEIAATLSPDRKKSLAWAGLDLDKL
jgi:hypothetical protein